eukprot:TRINITY_DN5388_c4_g1_i1.p2 TRINITY_DN5388_c4_g1~~TRINITY_DN5388_c4_g1_i1.p2  ORF type:complete len:158 (+),score=69.64 TRINITY_DN5388_c4_g1_i1:39-476(+)
MFNEDAPSHVTWMGDNKTVTMTVAQPKDKLLGKSREKRSGKIKSWSALISREFEEMNTGVAKPKGRKTKKITTDKVVEEQALMPPNEATRGFEPEPEPETKEEERKEEEQEKKEIEPENEKEEEEVEKKEEEEEKKEEKKEEDDE